MGRTHQYSAFALGLLRLQAGALRFSMLRSFTSLAAAIAAAADSTAAAGAPDGLASELRDAAQQFRHLLPQESDLTGMSAQEMLLLRHRMPPQLLQQAAHAAALMQQYHALPGVAAERQLALAQAAAGRSCAYLRCAHLGGEGGPAAGQGAGSQRCR